MTLCPKCKNEIPEGQPVCVAATCDTFDVEKIEYPEDGGILMHIAGYQYPYKGFPSDAVVMKGAALKRVFMITLRLLFAKPFVYLTPIVFGFVALMPKQTFRAIARWTSDIYLADFKHHELEPNRFCKSGRELLRVADVMLAQIDDTAERAVYRNFVLMLVMIWEYDNAYRYRGQDVLGSLNKLWLRNSARREILRLLTLLDERECLFVTAENRAAGKLSNDLREKWALLRRAVNLTLIFFPSLKRLIRNFLMELDVSKIALDEGDWYHVSFRFDYNYGGKTYEERRSKVTRNEVPPKLQQAEVSIAPNPYFFTINEENMEKVVDNVQFHLRKLYAENKKVQPIPITT